MHSMFPKSKIDIIIPNYNKSNYLDECIQSVLNQTYKNWNIYLIDDFSTDNSIAILNKYKNYTNIKIIKLKKNMGPAFCRNLGMRLSNSEYISFLDSDDYWNKEKLLIQLNFSEKNLYEFTFSDYYWFKESAKTIKLKSTNIVNNLNYKKFLKNSSINSSTMILKRDLIDNIKFKKVKHEDYLFKCDILRTGITAYKLNEKLVYYRIIENSRSGSKLNNILSLWKINSKYNKLNFIKNLFSVLFISINSIKKYGVK